MQKNFGTDPAELIACIGPSIEASCYEVGEDVAEPFREAYTKEESERILTPEAGKEGKFFLDLQSRSPQLLREPGLRPLKD